MPKPVIGIVTRKFVHAARVDQIQTVTIGIQNAYIDAVLRSGGAPVLLPRVEDPEVVARVVETIDGLLLTGGGDVAALRFGEQPHPANRLQDPIQDAMEIEVIRVALAKSIPILGICRGVQMLNIALGGTIIQDIPAQWPNAIQHFTQERETFLGHTIAIEPGTLLADLFGTTETAVNSWHHQSVKDLAQGLKVNCRAPDGVIEGVESDDGRPILALQCHPEEASARHPLFQRLFDWLVQEAEAV